MKKLLPILLSVATTFSGISAYANNDLSVYVDGEKLEFDVNPFIEDSRTLVPMRKIFEELGCAVEYYVDTDGFQNIVARRVDDYMYLVIGSNQMYVNGENIELDVPAKIVNDRTFVPLRAISESLNAKVDWIDATKTVEIESAKGEHTIRAKNLAEYAEKYEISILYPFIENGENNEFIDELNKQFEENAKKLFGDTQKELAEIIAEDENPSEKMVFQETFRVNCDADSILSISHYDYGYYGGAHPFSVMTSVNYNLEKGEEINLAEVLQIEESELEKLVIDNFKEVLEAEELYDEFWAKQLKENAKNVSFYLTDTMVTLYFNQYEIGPYAMGMPAIDFLLIEENADYYAELMEIVTSTEVGTAGSSLKAVDKLKELAAWLETYSPIDDELYETLPLCLNSVQEDMQDECDEQVKLLCSTFRQIVSDIENEYDFSRNDLINLAKFVLAAEAKGEKLITPFETHYDQDATYYGLIKGVENDKIKTEFFTTNIYDAVEVTTLKKGDMIVAQNGVLIVESIEETNYGYDINGGLENGGAWLKSNEGGTYVETLMDDDLAKTSVGEFTLNVSNDAVFVDKSNLGEEDKAYNGKNAVLNAIDDTINYGTLEILVENNEITSIIKHYHP